MAFDEYIKNKKLHTKFVPVKIPPKVKEFIKLQSGFDILYTNLPEATHLDEFLSTLDPLSILDIGCGIGRGSVYLANRYGWLERSICLYDGDSGKKTFYGANRTGKNEFYNDLKLTKEFCRINGLANIRTINAEDVNLSDVELAFDLAYSFLAIGFHWDIKFYLNDLEKIMNPDGIVIFGTQGSDKRDGDDFTKKQLNEIDTDNWKLLGNFRDAHGNRSSVVVLQRTGE